jgi:predicted metallopeptidase
MPSKIWRVRDDYQSVLKETKRKYPTFLNHVVRHRVFLCSFEKEHWRGFVARIHSIRPPIALAMSGFDYLIEFHADRFDKRGEAFQMYVMLHELLHIKQGGFDPESPNYRRLVHHDIEDFNLLLSNYGLNMENVGDVLKGEEGLFKKGTLLRFPRLEKIG